MMLNIGESLKCELSGQDLIVKKFLGGGGQGEVYTVEGKNGIQAIKWYNTANGTLEQKDSILNLIRHGPPSNAIDQFIWPLDIVTSPNKTQFGYLMPLIERNCFAELGEVQNKSKPAPNFKVLAIISSKIAESYRALHLDGFCYKDISAGNLMFDPINGDILICDNDNVGINHQSKSQVSGTMEFMAPEVVMGEDPSTETDQHSLAVLLFNLWVWHHPLHGELEYNIRCLDLPAKRKLYGESPVFIFDPSNSSNKLPNDPEYLYVNKMWNRLPSQLKEGFIQAFTTGLKNPTKRVTETQWRNLFYSLIDGAIECPKCKVINLWDGGKEITCWYDQNKFNTPPKLIISHPTEKKPVLLTPQTQILGRHINFKHRNIVDNEIIGSMIQNPNDLKMWGINNQSPFTWKAIFTDKTSDVPHGKSVPLRKGTIIDLNGVMAEIVE